MKPRSKQRPTGRQNRPHAAAVSSSSRRQPQHPPSPSLESTCGFRAALAVLRCRPEAVHAVYRSNDLEIERVEELEAAIDRARQERARNDLDESRPADARELERHARTPHHEGVTVLAEPRKWLAARELAQGMVPGEPLVTLAFDRVRNPYNIGAILRAAAFFGVDGVLFGPMAPEPDLAPLAVRVAEGGVEHLRLSRTTDLGAGLKLCAERGASILALDGGARSSIFDLELGGPVVFVVGNEREGISAHVRRACTDMVAIPGALASDGDASIESLNVAMAASIVIAHATRR